MTINYPKSGLCKIFCNRESSLDRQEKLRRTAYGPRAVCCAGLPNSIL